MNEEKKKRTRKVEKEQDIEKLKEELKEELKKELLEEQNKKEEPKNNKTFEEKVKETADKIMDTEDKTNDYEKKDIENNKIMAILAYFGPLCFIPYLVSKESKFAQYHAKQGLNLFILEFAISLISYFLMSVFEFSKMCNAGGVEYVCGVYTPIWISIPIDFASLIIGIVSLIGLIYACQGKAKEIPLLGKIKIIK